MSELDNRRPLKSRGAGWAGRLAATLAGLGASPDMISALSLTFSGLGAGLLLWAGLSTGLVRAVDLVLAAVCIQLRLTCNLLDGLVAVEHGRGSPAGPIWNELPDRFADLMFLVCAGYAAELNGVRAGALAGWVCGAGAVITAYVRELGRGLGFPADFSGPMAKPQRMAALTLTCGVAAVEPLWRWHGQCLMIGLAVIALGTLVTIARRTRTLARRLRERAATTDEDKTP